MECNYIVEAFFFSSEDRWEERKKRLSKFVRISLSDSFSGTKLFLTDKTIKNKRRLAIFFQK